MDDTSSANSSNANSHQITSKSATRGKSSGNITENSFDDKVIILAQAAKEYMRMCVAYGNVFPPTDAVGDAIFTWDVIKQSSSMPVL